MRLWTLHPKYLDGKGLVALWREALLAQKVLQGKTKGYRSHPQLKRFRAHLQPVAAVASYLKAVYEEACRRGYNFDGGKISPGRTKFQLKESNGQLLYEWEHLRRKLQQRDPEIFAMHKNIRQPQPHPLFRISRGKISEWEKVDESKRKS
jgi:hypothetical protein